MTQITSKPIIWLVDENPNELGTHSQVLSHAMPEYDVRKFLAPSDKSGVLEALASDLTSAFLLDQKMRTTGVTNYDGTDLAKFINTVNPRIPVFILTKYPHEWAEFSSSSRYIEDVLDKTHVRLNTELFERLVARITRRVTVYREDMDARQEKVRSLLRKSLTDELTPEELNSLEDLEVSVKSGMFAAEVAMLKEFGELLETQSTLRQKYGRQKS